MVPSLSPESLPENRKIPIWTNVTDLELDAKNYRFPEDESSAGQGRLINLLDDGYDLIDIGHSIAINGYFDEEPLIAVVEGGRKIIVEGNRRLAALKLLTQPGLRDASSRSEEWEELAHNLEHRIDQVPVLFYDSREELTNYVGVRHISGVVTWDPLAKARFLNSLVHRGDQIIDFQRVATETGSKARTVKQNYIAYRVYLQAKNDFQIDTSKVEDEFSIFFRAVNYYTSLSNFIGLNADRPAEDLLNPLPIASKDSLAELIGYVNGTGEVRKVISDSRDLDELAAVVSNEEGLRSIRLDRNLEKAFELSGGESYRLLEHLKNAGYYLDEAHRDAHRHTTEPDVIDAVRMCGTTMSLILRHFPNVQQEIMREVAT
jgi:hypothetical protein